MPALWLVALFVVLLGVIWVAEAVYRFVSWHWLFLSRPSVAALCALDAGTAAREATIRLFWAARRRFRRFLLNLAGSSRPSGDGNAGAGEAKVSPSLGWRRFHVEGSDDGGRARA
ncbi:MAG: hypothetical protein H7A53_04495 [Akkermansiaceae bacterium]|nr:hypothetical protein [Akkermansiaceae bacterium]